MTNIERIKQMDAEEMADFIVECVQQIDCDECPAYPICRQSRYRGEYCKATTKTWLESEASKQWDA